MESLPADSLEYKYFSQAIHDEDYRDTITHYLCGVSTEEIRSFEPNDSHYYYIEDLDVSITVLFPSVHIRDCDLMPLTPMGSISGLTPTADGDLF